MSSRKIKKIVDAEKIAAGEVVDRPANIVKELIENSIDAGAKEIRIVVKKAGKNLIQIIDDGYGILPDEILIAFERYTSSKIVKIEDLEKLSTLGFRGEALASIAAVSQVEITSRVKENERGINIILKAGKLVEKKEVFCPIGTNIKVKNIFYNIPARKKFLKQDPTELGHITDIIQRYSLAYPQIHFIYNHNEMNILNCPGSNDLRTTVFHIYGKKVANFMELINYKGNNIKLHGLLGHSEVSKNNRTHSSLFLNKRYVISDLLFRAVQEAYKGILMIGKFPFFILHLEIDPSVIDFNVHPKKLQIRFENEEYVYNKVYNIVRMCVEEKFMEEEISHTYSDLSEFSQKENDLEVITFSKDTKSDNAAKDKHPKVINEVNESKIEIEQLEHLFLEEIPTEKTVQLNLSDKDNISGRNDKSSTDSFLRGDYIKIKNFPKLRLVSQTGQLSNKTYIVLEGINKNREEGFYILDQHAASERVNKEYFLNYFQTSKKERQNLINPLTVEVSPSEKFFLEANLKQINKLGFDFEHFRGNTFVLRAVPTIMGRIPNINLITEIISDITEIGKEASFTEKLDEIVNYLACHKSIRGGDDMSLKSIRKLIIDLGNCKDSFHCAHGRPTLKFFSFKELDKLFKRVM
ncbi:MAG: DNA mismatch repair endonuclease MutL [Candidatus Lokiarchaeota archaeon]|nr:DNA mismatch repair endonuclease MutL [Candidatus Lokiarchaeota archaeon]